VGTTSVLDLHVSTKGQFKLTAHASYNADGKNGWHASWSSYQSVQRLSDEWRAIEAYVENAIFQVVKAGKHLKEGMLQSAIARTGGGIAMFDRESSVTYTTAQERSRNEQRVLQKWMDAAARDDAPSWWTSDRPTGPSTGCDILGVSKQGQLLTIEVKPSNASADKIAWAPVQARMYSDFFQGWLDERGGEAADIITEMINQQQRIGMRSRSGIPAVDWQAPVKAVVAIDRRSSQLALGRLQEVLGHYDAIGMPIHADVKLVDLIGRMHALRDS
jgi:hypothetical protein